MKSIQITVMVIAMLFVSAAGVWALNDDNANTEGQENQYVFTGQEDHSITLNEANRFVQRYVQKGDRNLPNGEYFGGDALLGILSQEGCVGIRTYYAINDEGTQVMVLVGVDQQGNDMLKGMLAERGLICPPWCGDLLKDQEALVTR